MRHILTPLCGVLILTSTAFAETSYDANEMFSPQDVAKIRAAYVHNITFSISLDQRPATADSYDRNEAFSPAQMEQIRAAYDERPLSDRDDDKAGF